MSFKHTNAHSIYITDNYEWVDVIIKPWREGSHGFTLFIHSSFGNWNFGWASPGSSISRFLKETSYSYVSDKLTTKVTYWNDIEDIIKNLIIEDRRNDALTAEEAREAWGELQDATFIVSPRGLIDYLHNLSDCDYFTDYDFIESIYWKVEGPPKSFKQFYKTFWDKITEALSELESQGKLI